MRRSVLLSTQAYLKEARSRIASLRTEFRCIDCGAPEGHRSCPRNSFEKYIYPIFLQQPVRCDNCARRSWVSLFTVVRGREQ